MTLIQAAGDTTFFLEFIHGTHHLKQTHAHYYQVQAQMKLCQGLHCDFVVWTEIIQKILPEQEFI